MPNSSFAILRRHPIIVGIATLGLVIALFGGWAAVKANRKLPKKHPAPEMAKVEPAPLKAPKLDDAPASSGMNAKPSDDDDDDGPADPPETTEPDDDKPIVIGKADPELDQFVAKEQKDYSPETKPVGKLTAVKVSVPGARSPFMVAKQLDAILDQKLVDAKIPVSPVSTDAEFIRRASIDITGIIPTASKVKAFLLSKDPEKRAKVVDELLADSEYGQNAAHTWHDLLVKRDSDNNKTIKSQDVFVKWMASGFNANKPWNVMVKEMLTAKGDQATVGETFFILANAETGQPAPNKIVGTAAALFLGTQLMCSECHIHPVTPEWTQQEFWGLAAFFGHTRAEREPGLKKNNTNANAKITDEAVPGAKVKGKNKALAGKATTQADGSIPIPDPRNDGKFIGTAKAKVLDGTAVGKSDVTRATAAEWMVSANNPYFARAAVNRLWAGFFATGFINPLDDIRPDSVASHPAALDLLAEEFIASKFDLKHMIRVIARTEAYNRSSKTTAANHDKDLYSHMAMKVLSPRSLFKSMALATSNAVEVPSDPKPGDKPAKQDTSVGGLTFFDAREYDENPGEYTYGVPQLLRLMNSKLPPACDAFAKGAAKLGATDKVLDHLYLTALSRNPTPIELQKMTAFVKKHSSAEKGYSAVMWVLLNSAEFVNNH